MALEEPQLNNRVAKIVRELTAVNGWTVREELRGALRGPVTKPDILITRPHAPPITIENEYVPAATLEADCLKNIGRDVDPDIVGDPGTVNVVIALRSPRLLRECANSDAAERMLRDGVNLEYAVYQGDQQEQTRFPSSGFIAGDIRDLVAFIRPASEPEEVIKSATTSLDEGVQDAGALLLSRAQGLTTGPRIGEMLRQPWPELPSKPPVDAKELRQYESDRQAALQTARMAAAIIINAMAYQQVLAGHEGIRDLSEVRSANAANRLMKDDVLKEWDVILAINYWPIFHIARSLLEVIPELIASDVLPVASKTANLILGALRHNDVAGTVFQRLISDRQTLATYYTRPESAVLTALLAIPDDLDWQDPDTVRNYRIADYACGTGGLLLEAYLRVRELHQLRGGDPDELHAHMMERSLTACDIMPAAVHLTSSLLSSVVPQAHYKSTRNILYPFGGVKHRDRYGNPLRDDDGNPILERDSNGNPVVDIGSLELLDTKTSTMQSILPLSEQMVMGPAGRGVTVEVDMPPLSQSLVIMNPPFTTPTNHAADHVDTKNPAFAAFGTSVEEQEAMEERVRQLSRGTCGDGYAGLGSQFAAIADNMVQSGGHIALILPLSSMIGGSYDRGVARSWQKLRGMLASTYADIVVVSISDPNPTGFAFSADTNLAEVIIIARRLHAGEQPNRTAHFVNLNERPTDRLAAQEVARTVRALVSNVTEPGRHAPITIGSRQMGFVSLESIDRHRKWTAVRISDGGMYRRVKRLTQGELLLPQRIEAVHLPITRLGDLGQIGPVHRLFSSAFARSKGANAGTEYPFLWNHDFRRQDRMLVSPDSSGELREGMESAGMRLWDSASNLHISCEVAFNSNPTAAAFTNRRAGGGRAWPNVRMVSEAFERATCAWFNSTLGMMCYWIDSNRTQGARGGTTVTAIPNIATLDLTQLTPDQISAAVGIFDELSDERMLPANEAYRDPVRQEIDRRLLTEVLQLDEDAADQFAILRTQWCMEPTVTGTKRTGPAACGNL